MLLLSKSELDVLVSVEAILVSALVACSLDVESAAGVVTGTSVSIGSHELLVVVGKTTIGALVVEGMIGVETVVCCPF